MKHFKTEASRTAEQYEITSTSFDENTGRKEPFLQTKADSTVAHYGICPSCFNPIQIIGLVRETKCKPHGRHTGKTISDLPQWNQVKYEYCPYASKQAYREPSDDERLPDIDEGIVELYNLLKNHFDRIVYILSSELDIRASASFWKQTLNQFLVNAAYCYPWLTENNLPYIFAYWGMIQKSMYMQRIRIGSKLYECLSKHPLVDLSDVDDGYATLKNKARQYVNLRYRFYLHKQHAVEGEPLRESMMFCVDDISTKEIVFEQRIEFDETRFMSLVRQQDNDHCKRQQWLLDIANELMPELERTV